MRTHWVIATVVLVNSLAAHTAHAAAWVDKMITDREHDFGPVARGADTVYRFPVKNIYKQDIELVNVRTSCGCTSPTLEKRVLKTGETGFVVATFNTRTFTGLHGATLTLDVKWNDNGIWRRGETAIVFRHGVVSLVAMLVAFGIWLLSNAGWCDPASLLQGHAAWHLLCALAAYWLFRLYASERSVNTAAGRLTRAEVV